METVFDNVPDWPETETRRDPRFDNAPPLEERVMLEFEEDLERQGIKARVAELLESAQRVPEITDDTIAGKVGDLCKLARDVEKRIADAREKHNRPLLNAQRSLKAKADNIYSPLQIAIAQVRGKLNAYVAAEARRREDERRKAEEEARLAREAAAEISPELAEQIEAPRAEPKPIARGDLGASVGTRTVWRHAIEVPIKQLPKAVLESEPVREAIDKVIAAMIRAGNREIKGVKIWSEQEAAVR